MEDGHPRGRGFELGIDTVVEEELGNADKNEDEDETGVDVEELVEAEALDVLLALDESEENDTVDDDTVLFAVNGALLDVDDDTLLEVDVRCSDPTMRCSKRNTHCLALKICWTRLKMRWSMSRKHCLKTTQVSFWRWKT